MQLIISTSYSLIFGFPQQLAIVALPTAYCLVGIGMPDKAAAQGWFLCRTYLNFHVLMNNLPHP